MGHAAARTFLAAAPVWFHNVCLVHAPGNYAFAEACVKYAPGSELSFETETLQRPRLLRAQVRGCKTLLKQKLEGWGVLEGHCVTR